MNNSIQFDNILMLYPCHLLGLNTKHRLICHTTKKYILTATSDIALGQGSTWPKSRAHGRDFQLLCTSVIYAMDIPGQQQWLQAMHTH
jgi:hypothetical protein